MQPDLELLVKVQGLDIRSAELRKEIAALPKQIAEIEKTLESHQKRLDADKMLLAANQKERKLADVEIQAQQQKISKFRDQMTAAKNNEQYRAFQTEIEFCEKEIRKHEERVIVLMEESEPLERNVRAAESGLKQEREVVEKAKAEARERTAADQKLLDENMARRLKIMADVTPQAKANYERLFKRFNGVVISDGTKGRCSICHMEIRPQLLQDVRRGEKIYACESCNRLLYYNASVAFDPEIGAPVKTTEGTRVDMS